ncbi:TnpV protein [Acutalibacter muris]|uniref:TnpV protein n=1 Tax=Acutalibacter muris TaxID=1796620 RepID=UPI001C3EF2DF|nr:TnpV protein [Acutalibacter muris]
MENTLTYRQEGDFLLPELEVETPSTLGKYGRMRERYLREERPVLYNRLILSGKLTAHLTEIEQTANRRLGLIMPELQKSMGLTEQMKASDPMKWVGLMNNAKAKAEEMILDELIYR